MLEKFLTDVVLWAALRGMPIDVGILFSDDVELKDLINLVLGLWGMLCVYSASLFASVL